MSDPEPSTVATRGRISFIGAGPGAADLITVRAAKRLAEADIVVWAASLVTLECVRDHAGPDAELIDSSRITHEEVLDIYRRALRDRLNVARVHSGDPALWGAVQEQYDACQRMELEVEIVPGVSAFSAAAAAIGRELTVPEVAQSVVLTRLEGGKTPMPDRERIRDFARHGTTMAIFLSAARAGQLAEELRAGGYDEDTPIVVAYKVTWPDELLLHTTLGELEATVKQHRLWRHTLFLVGHALRSGGTRSRLYHAGHFHTYRKADKDARRALRSSSRARRGGAASVPLPPNPAPTPSAGADGSAGRGDTPATPGQHAEAAWWAVRNWQESARTAPRPPRTRAARQPAQDALFDGSAPASDETQNGNGGTASGPSESTVDDVAEAKRGGAGASAATATEHRVTARVADSSAADTTDADVTGSDATAAEDTGADATASDSTVADSTGTGTNGTAPTGAVQTGTGTNDADAKAEPAESTPAKTEAVKAEAAEPAKPESADSAVATAEPASAADEQSTTRRKSTRGSTKAKSSTRKTVGGRGKRKSSGTS